MTNRTLIHTAVVGVAAVSLLAAGCGGGYLHDGRHDHDGDAERSALLRPLHALPPYTELPRPQQQRRDR